LRFFFGQYVSDTHIADALAEALAKPAQVGETSTRARLFVSAKCVQINLGSSLPKALLLGRYYELRELSAVGQIGIDVKMGVRKQ